MLINWTLDYARGRGIPVAQLTTDKRREALHRFYADLGFASSHESIKLRL